ncbi:hypothetical protein AQUCO_02700424v1 [Aquilegia coerulea]|uniref:Enhancer of polycomb-like protein n=1 Tax=Aquilegia coerulea TaxID=218851 RepID=A0A2G5D6T8_AQUCA|nr:hypothetical protein AQUCO_02700424v1 [Aquilegia coerulea]
MRRSTRVFVPKSVGKDGNLGKVLRSGKRVLFESDETKQVGRKIQKGEKHFDNSDEKIARLPCYKSNGWRKVIPEQDVVDDEMDVNLVSQDVDVGDEETSVEESRYKNVYDRKRRRSLDESSVSTQICGDKSEEERLYGNFYVRKKWRRSSTGSSMSDMLNRVRNSQVDVDCHEVIESSDSKVGIFAQDSPSLDVIVESSLSSSLRFTCFFLSVLRFMRTSHITLSELAAFICGGAIVEVFSRHGVHFKQCFSPSASLVNDTRSSGFCRIFGNQRSIPLFWLDFTAVPLSFRNLHYTVFFRSLYVPHVLPCFLISMVNQTDGDLDEGKSHSSDSVDSSDSMDSIVIALPHTNSMYYGNSSAKKVKTNCADYVSGFDGRRVSSRHTVSRSFQKKRSSLRSKRVKSSSSVGFRGIQQFNAKDQIHNSVENKSVYVGLDMFGTIDKHNPSLVTPGSNQKQTKLVEADLCHRYKEVNSTKVCLGSNVDSHCCNANVLVIESDRCYREEGVTVMLECSTSKVWHVVVKAQGSTKYMHPAHEVMRPSTTNRFTHAMIWTAENGWRLEFCDRKDWLIFKEMHKECVSKNLEANSAKTIPVPGVREVVNYEDCERVPFSRPESYITVYNNEVARALGKYAANYDIDPEDEEWLEKFNSGLCVGDNAAVEHLSAEKFEEIIDVLEKAAYRSPGDLSDESKVAALCSDLGRGDVVVAVHQYWLKKRKQKRAALLRVFECQPPRKAQLMHENVLRKKRSFKKQVSQNGRAKPRYDFEGPSAEQEELALKRVQDAQAKAKESLASAVLKRKRAQALMDNADLATYLAAMALKIAESVEVYESFAAFAP